MGGGQKGMGGSAKAYVIALFTVVVWGLTFVSSKILLQDFTPVELLFARFAIAYVALWVICPRVLKAQQPSHELLFAALGATGVVLYFVLENGCLVYTNASVASVIVSAAPLFTAIVATITAHERHLGPAFLLGFALAMGGIALICLDGSQVVGGFNLSMLLGDGMALVAALMWAFYSGILLRVQALGYGTLELTKRTFFWGLVLCVPVLAVTGFSTDLARFVDPVNLLNLLFLGLVASAACYITWNIAVAGLGASKAAAFIYLQPIVTMVASVFVLDEPFTLRIAIGIVLVLAGLVLSERGRSSGRLTGNKHQKEKQ